MSTFRTGRLLTIHEDRDGTLDALDDHNPHSTSIPLMLVDLPQWRINLASFSQALQRVNRLGPPAGELDERLCTIGTVPTASNGTTLVVLALLADDAEALRQIQPLAALAPDPYQAILAVSPTFVPSEQLVAYGADHCIFFHRMQLLSHAPFKLDLQIA